VGTGGTSNSPAMYLCVCAVGKLPSHQLNGINERIYLCNVCEMESKNSSFFFFGPTGV
jgi:hypothetical protein